MDPGVPKTPALPEDVFSNVPTFLDVSLRERCQLRLVRRSSREDREDFDLKAAEGATGKRGRPDGAPAGAGSAGGKRVFVNNLAEETTWQALKDYFKQAGPVAHADVLTVRRSQCPGQNSFSKVVTSVMFHLLLLNVQQPPVKTLLRRKKPIGGFPASGKTLLRRNKPIGGFPASSNKVKGVLPSVLQVGRTVLPRALSTCMQTALRLYSQCASA